MSADDITEWLSSVSSCNNSTDVSHPLPTPPELTWDCPIDVAEQIRITLADLGQGSSQTMAAIECELKLVQHSGRTRNQL